MLNWSFSASVRKRGVDKIGEGKGKGYTKLEKNLTEIL